MVGVGAVLAGLTDLSPWSILLITPGLIVTIPALRRITPPGTLTARPGLPAASAAAFLASTAFFATDGFVTLMLTETRGLSIGLASLVLTAASIAWAVGSWWQSRTIGRLGARRVTAFGGMLIGSGSAIVAVGLLDVPVIVPYLGWTIGALGMGVVFPTIPLSVMGEAIQGREAGDLSSMILMDYLGVGIGAGLGVHDHVGGAVLLSPRCRRRDRELLRRERRGGLASRLDGPTVFPGNDVVAGLLLHTGSPPRGP